MPTSTDERLQAREASLFEIEPREERWELQVECVVDDGWQPTTFAIRKASLLRSQEE